VSSIEETGYKLRIISEIMKQAKYLSISLQ